MVTAGGLSGVHGGPVGAGVVMDGIWRDLKVAGRNLARRPGFTLAVTLTLGLAIGATTTTYAVVDGVMLRPLPYDDPSTLVTLGAFDPAEEWVDQVPGLQALDRMSLLAYQRLRERHH